MDRNQAAVKEFSDLALHCVMNRPLSNTLSEIKIRDYGISSHRGTAPIAGQFRTVCNLQDLVDGVLISPA
jgi:hypothetical protein